MTDQPTKNDQPLDPAQWARAEALIVARNVLVEKAAFGSGKAEPTDLVNVASWIVTGIDPWGPLVDGTWQIREPSPPFNTWTSELDHEVYAAIASPDAPTSTTPLAAYITARLIEKGWRPTAPVKPEAGPS